MGLPSLFYLVDLIFTTTTRQMSLKIDSLFKGLIILDYYFLVEFQVSKKVLSLKSNQNLCRLFCHQNFQYYDPRFFAIQIVSITSSTSHSSIPLNLPSLETVVGFEPPTIQQLSFDTSTTKFHTTNPRTLDSLNAAFNEALSVD